MHGMVAVYGIVSLISKEKLDLLHRTHVVGRETPLEVSEKRPRS